MVNYSDMELMHVQDEGNNDFVAMKFRCQIKDEFCNIVHKPRVKFGGHYESNGGTLIFGEGFLFNDLDEANDAAKLLAQVE